MEIALKTRGKALKMQMGKEKGGKSHIKRGKRP